MKVFSEILEQSRYLVGIVWIRETSLVRDKWLDAAKGSEERVHSCFDILGGQGGGDRGEAKRGGDDQEGAIEFHRLRRNSNRLVASIKLIGAFDQRNMIADSHFMTVDRPAVRDVLLSRVSIVCC